MSPAIIAEGEARMRAAVIALAALDADFARIEAAAGPLPYRRRPAGFEALLRSLVAQQLSVKAAEAIFLRLAALGPLAPRTIAEASDEALLGAGLSRQKLGYCRGFAEAITSGRLDLDGLVHLDDEAAIAALTAQKGIGRWTAEIYLMFALGRDDIWPAADLGVQAGAMHLKALPSRPTEKALRALGEAWRPYRSTAARLLWHHYGHVRTLKAAVPV